MKSNASRVCGLVTLVVSLALSAARARAGDVFVIPSSGIYTIAQYDTSGNQINPSFLTGLTSDSFTSVGNNLFVFSGTELNKTVSQYTTSGTQVGTPWSTGTVLGTAELTASGNNLWGIGLNSQLVVSYFEWTTSGTLLNTFPVTTDLPNSFAVSGGDIFVDLGTSVGEWTTSGTLVNASLITGLTNSAGIVVSGSNIFVDNQPSGESSTPDGYISQYTTSGVPVNLSLVPGLDTPEQLSLYGGNIFVVSTSFLVSGTNTLIGEYSMSGAPVNPSLISVPWVDNSGILPFVVVPEPATWVLAALGLISLRFFRRRC